MAGPRGGFGQAVLDEIRARVDLVELVGQAVALKRAGANWKGLCPFHQEKTPSFTVHPVKGIFHCFGCGRGGDAFTFLRLHERLDFPEAVRALAERVGVALPEERPAAGDGGRLEALRLILARAAQFYAEALQGPGGQRARQYLEGRGVDPEVARRFGLGWAPEGWDHLLGFMRVQGLPTPAPLEDLLVEAGLVLPRQTGPGHYDRFRGRLIFPIRDPQGRPVAFGGRALGGEDPKYLNSPETALYSKGQTLYALDLARPAIRERGRAVVVEGYLDCLIAHQHGFTETVAALGTAFTPAQLGLLRRHAEEVITVFDADAAGRKASARAEEMLEDLMDLSAVGWSVGGGERGFTRSGYFALKVATLPAGHDPDSLLRAEGADAFRSRLAEARSILSFVLAQALEDEDLSTERGRGMAHARAALLLSKVGSAEEATALARQAARRLGVDPTQLWIESRQLQGSRARQGRLGPAPVAAAPAEPPAPRLAERDLVALLLHAPAAREALLPLLADEDLSHPGFRRILGALREAPGAAPESLLDALEGPGEQGLLAALLVEEPRWADPEHHLGELVRRYEIRRRKRHIRDLAHAIVQAQATGDPALPGLQAELASLQGEARAVRELALTPTPRRSRPWPPASPAAS
jgi:DNA primase